MIFIIFSGVLGPRIISHGLVSQDGFQIYGGAGKALLFGAIALMLLVQHRGFIKIKPWHKANLAWLVLAVLAVIGAWLSLDRLIAGTGGTIWPVLTHVCIWASLIFAAGAAFGPATLRLLARTYWREVLIALGLAIVFYGFLLIVYGLWGILATIVLHSVRWLLSVVGVSASVLPGRTLVLDKFAITVAEYCSGIESIALFTALYALVGVLDWPRLNHRRFFWIFPLGLAVLFIFNILRVFGLILAGYYINQHIAFSLFHTYAGMVFFILYSILFWAVSYRWMLAD